MWIEWLIPIVLIVVVAPVAIYVAYKQARKRTEALQRVADQIGFHFDRAAHGMPPPEAAQFHLFSYSGSDLRNLLHGKRGDQEVYIFDHSYTVRGGKSSSTVSQTVAAFPIKSRPLTDFELRPLGTLDKIGSALGFQDIDFREDPDFSSRYVLKGKDEDAVRQLFIDRRRSACVRARDVCVEGGGGWLITYRARRRVEPDGISQFLDETRAIGVAFQEG